MNAALMARPLLDGVAGKRMNRNRVRNDIPAHSTSCEITLLLRMLLCASLSVATLFPVQAAQEDIAKYTDPNVRVTQLMEGGGLVIVSSLNVLPNNDLLAIVFARQDQAAGLGVKIAGRFAVLGRISKDNGQTWGPAFLILDSLADGCLWSMVSAAQGAAPGR